VSASLRVELKPEVTVMQLAGPITLGQAAGVRAERAAGGLARGRATRSTEARVAYNTRLQQTLPRLRAAAAEP
jgi:hypothetical protein